jgi:hypothetical protein
VEEERVLEKKREYLVRSWPCLHEDEGHHGVC